MYFTACATLVVERLQASGKSKDSMLCQVALPWILVVVVVVASWICLQPAHCKTVVMMPNPATSHTKYHTHVAGALRALGHDVWLTMPTYLSEKGYLDTSCCRVIPFETMPLLEERAHPLFAGRYFEGKAQNIFEFLRFSREIYDGLLRNETFLQTIKEKEADLIVIDNLPTLYPLAVIPYRLGKPFAFLGSSYEPISSRIPFSPAETPLNILPYSNEMTFSQRVETLLSYVAFIMFDIVYPSDIVSVYAPEMPYLPMDMLIGRAEVWLVEMDYILDYPRSTLPNVKLIGGTASGPAKPLPPEFQVFMEGATKGVVIVSFGSYVLGLSLIHI